MAQGPKPNQLDLEEVSTYWTLMCIWITWESVTMQNLSQWAQKSCISKNSQMMPVLLSHRSPFIEEVGWANSFHLKTDEHPHSDGVAFSLEVAHQSRIALDPVLWPECSAFPSISTALYILRVNYISYSRWQSLFLIFATRGRKEKKEGGKEGERAISSSL